jgi:hypothetical protein
LIFCCSECRNSINIFGSTASSPDIINLRTANATRLTISNTGVSTFTTTENQGGLYVTSATDNTTIRVASTATNGQEWRLQSTGGSSGLGQGKLIIKVGGTETTSHIPLTLTTDNSTIGGRVGIGTTSPGARLQVEGGEIRATTSNAGVALYANGSNGEVAAYNWAGSAYLNLSMVGLSHTFSGGSGSPRMTLTSAGRLLVNTTSENDAIFQVHNNSSNYAAYIFANTIYAGSYRIMRMFANGNTVMDIGSSNGTDVGFSNNQNGFIALSTNGSERMRITAGGAIVQNSVNGRLTKTGSTSVTFTLTIGSIGAWTPGYATIRVSGTRGGLQEHYAAMYFLKLVYFQGSNTITVNNLSGDTGSASVSVSTAFTSGNTVMTITISDGGASTDYMIADIDASAFTGIGSIT